MLISLVFSLSSDRQGAGKNRVPAMHVTVDISLPIAVGVDLLI